MRASKYAISCKVQKSYKIGKMWIWLNRRKSVNLFYKRVDEVGRDRSHYRNVVM